MNSIKSMTIYSEYIKLINTLKPKEKRDEFLGKIIEFYFYDIEPIFDEDSLEGAIWDNLIKPIKKYKAKSLNGLKGGAPDNNKNAKKQANKQTKKQPNIQPKVQTKNKHNKDVIVNVDVLKNNNIPDNKIIILNNTILTWLEYKTERKEIYKDKGLKALITQIENNVLKYGVDQVIDLINDSMANNYKGIIFEKLKAKLEIRKKVNEVIYEEI